MTVDPRIIEQFNQRAPFKWEDATLLVLAQVGSHSHGTYIPPEDPQAIDDVDYMGIVIPPQSYTLGLKEWDNLTFIYEELDCVFYSFRKYVNLLIKSNPNVLGLTWLNDEHYVAYDELLWYIVRGSRSLFSSKLAYPSFIGYATAQLRKMTSFDIATQNEWDDAVKLITAAGWTVGQITGTEKSRPMPDYEAVLDVLVPVPPAVPESVGRAAARFTVDDALERAALTIHKIHAKHFQGYMGEKRKNLVRKYGYDTKNASHLIRLMRMCCEYLESGKLQVFRTIDAYHLRDIKAGKYPLELVKEEAESLFKRAESLRDNNALPMFPDLEAIDLLVQEIYLRAYNLWVDGSY
jgi:hypothetical protein